MSLRRTSFNSAQRHVEHLHDYGVREPAVHVVRGDFGDPRVGIVEGVHGLHEARCLRRGEIFLSSGHKSERGWDPAFALSDYRE